MVTKDMEDIYYLVHVTNNSDCLNWSELRTSSFNTDHQFPGVYFSLITKDNIDTENIYPGKYILVFSKNLLYQKNYHINLVDYNGIITEKNTYYPWMLNNFISKNKELSSNGKRTMNEIVFHDNIDMKCCCCVNIRYKNTMNYFLPKLQLENTMEPDMTKIPFFCFPFEYIYTGCNPLDKSSRDWCITFSKLANISDTADAADTADTADTLESLSCSDIIEKIKNKAEYLYNNREEQNIKILYEYTMR